jgi:hypothetical protein
MKMVNLTIYLFKLEGLCRKEKISFVFSCSERAILSGLYLIKGLCPNNDGEILKYVLNIFEKIYRLLINIWYQILWTRWIKLG